MMNVSKRFAIALAIVSIALASEARAVDRFWIDTGVGLNNWNDKENWNPNDDYVKAGDNAFFDQDAIYTVILQAPSAAGNVTFSDGSGTVDAIDYGIWKTNFGISAGTVFAALEYAAVPEPATVVPLAIALCGLIAVRRGAFMNRATHILVRKANGR
jgi:hypothetical protein